MGTVTIGSDTFDVYGTAAGLATYANGSATYYATYAAAATADVSRAHVEATRQIALLPFDDDANAVPSTADADVATACYELTLAALLDAAVLTRATTASNVKRIEAKGVVVENFAPVAGSRFPARVMALLSPLLAGASSATAPGVYASGTSSDSSFDDGTEDDRYGITGG